MVKYQILYWKNLASQVKVFEEGKRPVSLELPGRLAEIDRIAMEEGLAGTDDYLSHWRWTPKKEREGSAAEVAEALVKELMQQTELGEETGTSI